MKKIFTLISAFIISVLCLNAQNDSLPVKDLFDLSLEELLQIKIVSASKRAQNATDAPATVYVITSEQISSRNYSSLQELMNDIPQIEIQRKAYAEFSDVFTINGISGNEKFLILMDGIRVNSITGTQHTLGESYLLDNVKQVEVILGPASSLYGADAFTGIVNIITYKGFEKKGIFVNTSYGLFNTLNSSMVFNTGKKDLSFSVVGKYYQSDEPFLPDYYPAEFAWYNRYKQTGEMELFGNTVIPEIGIKPWETPTDAYTIISKLNFKKFEFGYSRFFESHSSSIGYLPNTSIYSKEAIYANHVQNLYATHGFVSADEKFALNSTVSVQEFKLYPRSLFLNQYAGFNNAYKFERNRALKIEEQFNYFVSDKFNIVGGASYEYLNAIPKTSDLPYQYDESLSSEEQNIYYPGTNITDVDGNNLTIIQDIYNISYHNFGSYLQVQASIIENLTLTAGARYDYNSRYKSTLNPRVGLVYRPIRKLHIKLLYGNAYLAPSPYKSYQHYGSFYPITNIDGDVVGLGSGFWHLPNPDLEPEKRVSYDGYMMYQVTPNFALTLNGYFSEISNLIGTEGFFGLEFHGIPVDYVQKNINRGNAKAYGGTFRVDYRKHMGAGVTTNLFAAYSYSDGEIAGNPLIFSAKNTVKTGLDINFRNIFNVYTTYLYRSGSHHKNSTSDYEILSNPFSVVNLTANYRVIKTDKFTGNIFVKTTNILNSKYYHAGYENMLFIPQDPFRLNIGIKLDM
jgi:iron complex outermembrane receptor protein